MYYYIYSIINQLNGKLYVGKRVSKRVPEKDTNYYGSGKTIKAAITKYGKESFTKAILETCPSIEVLAQREIYWIAELESYGVGYNLTPGGPGGHSMTGKKHSEETKEKIRQRALGRKRTKETSDRIKTTKILKGQVKGNYHTEAHKAKLSLRFKEDNPVRRPEVRAKIGAANTGRPRTQAEIIKNIETRRKNGSIYKDTATRAKISATNRLIKNLGKSCCLSCKKVFKNDSIHICP